MAKLLVGLGLVLTTLLAQPVFAAESAGGDAVPTVPAKERSQHFAAVTKHLELGGTLFGYVDIDGDVNEMAVALRQIADSAAEQNPQAAMFQQDFVALFAELGFSDVKAFGFSSVDAGGGLFRNRAFLYTPNGRHGLLNVLGGAPAPFKHLNLAPAEADVYFETDVDLAAVYDTLQSVSSKVLGAGMTNMAVAKLKAAGKEAGISALGLIQKARGSVAGVMRLDSAKPMTIPGKTPVVIPGISLLLRFDGIGAELRPLLEKSGAEMFSQEELNGIAVFTLKAELPVDGLRPLIAFDGDALVIATSRQFFDACYAKDNRLSAVPQFQSAVAAVGTEGNALGYVSPHVFAEMRRLKELNPSLPPEAQRVLDFIVRKMPATDFPLVSVRVNRPDGVLFVASMNRSLKQDLAMVVVYNPVTIGALAAMAIPAFQKTQSAAQTRAIQNNLRQLSSAADQYYLDHGVATVKFEELVGPGKPIEQLESVDGEDYSAVVLKSGERLTVTTASGEEVSFGGE